MSRTSLPPFPVEFLDLPDEELALAYYAWRSAAALQSVGIELDGVPFDQISAELREPILFAALHLARRSRPPGDTDNENLTGLEKAERLMEPDADGNVARENLRRAGSLIHQFFERQIRTLVDHDEAVTRRRHQRAIARNRRTSYPHILVTEILKANPDIESPQIVDELERRWRLPPPEDDKAPRITGFDRTKGYIEWQEPDGRIDDMPVSGIPDLVSRVRKELGFSRWTRKKKI